MDKLKHYKDIVRNIVTEIGNLSEGTTHNLEVQVIIDDKHGQYLLYNNTWNDEHRHYGCFLHLEVRNNGKIWIHHDGTDLIVGEKLLDSGVPKHDIVLGFRAPIVRPDTGFAVA